jgi:hypothetical protein
MSESGKGHKREREREIRGGTRQPSLLSTEIEIRTAEYVLPFFNKYAPRCVHCVAALCIIIRMLLFADWTT